MLIVGAKGFAKEVLEVLHQLKQLDNLVFYDDVNDDVPAFLYGQFPVLKSKEAAAHYFKTVYILMNLIKILMVCLILF